MFRRGCTLLGVLTIFFLSACTLFEQQRSNTQPTAAEQLPVQEVAPAQLIATPETAVSTTLTNTVRTLRVWIPPELNEAPEGESSFLAQQINNYALSQPDLNLILEIKTVSGQGGILSYLRTGRNIAPSILPDVVAIPADQLASTYADTLIYPLTGLVEPEKIEELYPAAQTFARVDEVLVGYPFSMNGLSHFAYNNQVITQTISPNWDTLFVNTPLAFAAPLATTEGSILLLQLYLQAGGTLVNDAGQIIIEPEPLAVALTKLRNSVENSQLNATLSQSGGLNELWSAYEENRITALITTAEAYLRQTDVEQTAVSPISGLEEPLTPIVTGWAWAVSTPNSSQQQLAVSLIDHLTIVERQGRWSQNSFMLPSHPSALASWNGNGEYVEFLHEQLVRAEALPPNATLQILGLFQEAALQVISGDASPQAAAAAAAAILQE